MRRQKCFKFASRFQYMERVTRKSLADNATFIQILWRESIFKNKFLGDYGKNMGKYGYQAGPLPPRPLKCLFLMGGRGADFAPTMIAIIDGLPYSLNLA